MVLQDHLNVIREEECNEKIKYKEALFLEYILNMDPDEHPEYAENLRYAQELIKKDTLIPVTGRTSSYINDDGEVR